MKREARREGRRKAEGAEREGEMEERGWSLSIFTPQLCRLLVPGVNSAFLCSALFTKGSDENNNK